MNTDKAKRSNADWEAVEREYRAGQFSVSEIGRQYGVSHTAINKKAKIHSWTRNLTERVRQEVSARLVSDEVSATTAAETVELAATRGVQIVREHRDGIKRGRKIVDMLMEELEGATVDIEAIEEEIEIETASDRNSQRRGQMLRAVALPSRAGSIVNLASAMKTLVTMERQAFNLDDGTVEPDAHRSVIEMYIIDPCHPG